jgi:hypothetical protein
MDAEEAIAILSLVSTLEPPTVAFFKSLLEQAQGKTGDQFLAEADTIWAQIKANAQKELSPRSSPADWTRVKVLQSNHDWAPQTSGDVDETMRELQTGTPEATSLSSNRLQMLLDLGKVSAAKKSQAV